MPELKRWRVLLKEKSIPGVLSASYGTRIPIKGTKKQQWPIYKPERFFSAQLQVICDHDLFITDAFCGYQGSVHDARVFRNSPVCRDVESNPVFFPDNTHILGDAAYSLKTWLLTPFRYNGRLTLQWRFNVAHSATRMAVERCIGLYTGCFWELKTLMDINNLEDIP